MEEFNGQFSDVFTKSEYKQVPLMDRSATLMHDIVVTKEGVTKLLKGLNPSKALGPDELHPRVLKELAVELGPVFAHLFQQSIDTGEIPKEWSLANICPLFKKGDRSLARNYRRVRNKQLPTCPSRVKFGGGNLILLKGCPQDNLKFSKKCLISSFLDELKYKFKAMTIGLYL